MDKAEYKGTAMKRYLVAEQYPSPAGDTVRPLVWYDSREDAEVLLSTLKALDTTFSVYVIVEKDVADCDH